MNSQIYGVIEKQAADTMEALTRTVNDFDGDDMAAWTYGDREQGKAIIGFTMGTTAMTKARNKLLYTVSEILHQAEQAINDVGGDAKHTLTVVPAESASLLLVISGFTPVQA